MCQVVLFEALHFLTRDDLDACQLSSSYCRKLVARNTRTLSLRYVHSVTLHECSNGEYVSVDLTETGQTQSRFVHRHEPLVPADDYADLLRLFNHSFVNELSVCSFCGGFFDYWLRCKDEISCGIGMFRPHHSCQAVNYDDCLRRVHFVLNTLQPSVYCADVYSGQPCFTLGLETVRNSVSRLVAYLELWDNVDVHTFDNLTDWLFHAARLQRCDIVFNSQQDPALTEWISSIVERFESSTAMVQSLSIIWMLQDDLDENNLPLVHRLQAPSSIVAKPPRNDFVAEFCKYWDLDEYEEPPAQLFTFRNSACGKVLNIHKWIVTTGAKIECIALLFETVDSF